MGGASVDDAFVAWCESKGCRLDGVELRVSPRDPKEFTTEGGEAIGSADGAARGRGVFASRDFAKGDRVLTVPYAACLGTAGLKCGAGSGASPPFEGASPAECLAWTLLAARADDGDAWAPYLSALPSAIDSPTSGSWDRKEVAELQIGEAVFKTAVCLAKDAKAARAIAGGAGLPGDAPPGEDDAARDARVAREWAWALSCVRSRAVELTPEGGGSPQSLLVPFVDMLNHVHVDPRVSWTSVPGDGDGDAGAAVALVAERDVSAGDELTISYAAGASSDAFALYMGFLGGHNQWDSVELFKSLRAAAAWYANTFKSETGETVVDVAKAQAVADAFERRAGPGIELRLGWGGRVSDALVDMLVYFNRQVMPDEEPGKMAAHAVKVRCSELLTAFATTPEQDLDLLERGEGTHRFKLAVEYRLRKKAILQHFMES
jgi:hypothetical protein